MVIRTSPLDALETLYGTCVSAFWTSGSSNLRPMKRLALNTVFSGLVMAWRRATWPTRRSPVLGLTATTDGVRRLPSAFSNTVGSPPSMMATTEFVVPRSIPSTFGICVSSFLRCARGIRLLHDRPADDWLVLLSVVLIQRGDRGKSFPQRSLDALLGALEVRGGLEGCFDLSQIVCQFQRHLHSREIY